MDKSERYLKDIAKNTADIAKELKKMNRSNLTIDLNDFKPKQMGVWIDDETKRYRDDPNSRVQVLRQGKSYGSLQLDEMDI